METKKLKQPKLEYVVPKCNVHAVGVEKGFTLSGGAGSVPVSDI